MTDLGRVDAGHEHPLEHHAGDPLFDGPGEMRALCRARDWSSTPLGPSRTWPTSLRTLVATLLASAHPMFLFWGPELVQIYNDAYRVSSGTAAVTRRRSACGAGSSGPRSGRSSARRSPR